MTDKKIIEAYKVLSEESWNRTKKHTHKVDLPQREKQYNEYMVKFNKDPDGFMDDTIADIGAYFDW